MPKKPLYPTVYPKMSRVDALSAMAAIFASGAVRAVIQDEFQDVLEPEIEQIHVHHETSVNSGNIETCSKMSLTQQSLFGDDEL